MDTAAKWGDALVSQIREGVSSSVAIRRLIAVFEADSESSWDGAKDMDWERRLSQLEMWCGAAFCASTMRGAAVGGLWFGMEEVGSGDCYVYCGAYHGSGSTTDKSLSWASELSWTYGEDHHEAMSGLAGAVGSIEDATWIMPLAILGCALASQLREWRAERWVQIACGYDEGDILHLGGLGPDGVRFEVGF